MYKSTATKKSFASLLLAAAALFGILTATGAGDAFFTFLGNTLNFNATVIRVDVNDIQDVSSLQVVRDGTSTLTVIVTRNTVFKGGPTSISDIAVGDELRIKAYEDKGVLIASSITSEKKR